MILINPMNNFLKFPQWVWKLLLAPLTKKALQNMTLSHSYAYWFLQYSEAWVTMNSKMRWIMRVFIVWWMEWVIIWIRGKTLRTKHINAHNYSYHKRIKMWMWLIYLKYKGCDFSMLSFFHWILSLITFHELKKKNLK